MFEFTPYKTFSSFDFRRGAANLCPVCFKHIGEVGVDTCNCCRVWACMQCVRVRNEQGTVTFECRGCREWD